MKMHAKKSGAKQIVVLAALGATTFSSLPAQAGVLSQLRDSISSLRHRRQSNYQQSRQSRERASTLKYRGMAVREQLESTQRLLDSASDTYANYRHQAEQTEDRIDATKKQVKVAERKYKQHLDRFQRRLASFQRSGHPTYLQVFLGSRTLSDLTRRTYLFNTIAAQDSQLHQELEDSRLELERKRNMLASQWNQRNRLVQAAYREKTRVAQAEGRQRNLLNELRSSQSSAVSLAASHYEDAEQTVGSIRQLSAQQDDLVQEYERRATAARAVREYADRRSSRRARSTQRSGGSRRSRRTSYRSTSSAPRYTRRSNRRGTRGASYAAPSYNAPNFPSSLPPMSLEGVPRLDVSSGSSSSSSGGGSLSEDFQSE